MYFDWPIFQFELQNLIFNLERSWTNKKKGQQQKKDIPKINFAANSHRWIQKKYRFLADDDDNSNKTLDDCTTGSKICAFEVNVVIRIGFR